MDTHSTDLPLPRAEALRRLVNQVLAGGDAIVAAGAATAGLLDDAAAQLAGQRCRVLRVAAGMAGGLSLSGLMAQVTGQSDLTAQDDQVLKRVFQALTVLDPDCDRIVLLVSDAEGLQQPALRYIHFASRVGTGLQLVLAGEHGPPDLLGAETASLQTRLAAHPVINVAATPGPARSEPVRPVAIAAAPIPVARDILPAPSPAAPATAVPQAVSLPSIPLRPALSSKLAPRSKPLLDGARRRAWIAGGSVGAGMVACIALGILIGRRDWSTTIDATPAPAAPRSANLQADAPSSAAEPDRAAASNPASMSPPVAPGQAMLPDLPVPPPYLPEAPSLAPGGRSKGGLANQGETRAREAASVRRPPRGTTRFPEYRDPTLDLRDTSGVPFMGSRPLWQPPRADPPPSRAGETRGIGTYTIDESGVRVFRLNR